MKTGGKGDRLLTCLVHRLSQLLHGMPPGRLRLLSSLEWRRMEISGSEAAGHCLEG